MFSRTVTSIHGRISFRTANDLMGNKDSNWFKLRSVLKAGWSISKLKVVLLRHLHILEI